MAAIDSVLWWPTGRHDKLVSIDEQNLFLWSLDASKKTAQVRQTLDYADCVLHITFISLYLKEVIGTRSKCLGLCFFI